MCQCLYRGMVRSFQMMVCALTNRFSEQVKTGNQATANHNHEVGLDEVLVMRFIEYVEARRRWSLQRTVNLAVLAAEWDIFGRVFRRILCWMASRDISPFDRVIQYIYPTVDGDRIPCSLTNVPFESDTEIIRKAFDLEQACINLFLPVSLPDLSVEDMMQDLEITADLALRRLGYEPCYHSPSNFFEIEPVEYKM